MTNSEIIVHIVDDDDAVRNSLSFLLGNSGFAVRTHLSATDFLRHATGVRNACLVTDLRMPDMSGVELLKRLRDIDALLPVVVITGQADGEMAAEALRHGAVELIEKPFSEDVLIASIQRAVDSAGRNPEAGVIP